MHRHRAFPLEKNVDTRKGSLNQPSFHSISKAALVIWSRNVKRLNSSLRNAILAFWNDKHRRYKLPIAYIDDPAGSSIGSLFPAECQTYCMPQQQKSACHQLED